MGIKQNRHNAVKRNARHAGRNFPRHPQWGNNGDQDYFQFEYVWHSVLLNLDAEKERILKQDIVIYWEQYMLLVHYL